MASSVRVCGAIACIGSASSMHLTDLVWYNATPVFYPAAARTGVRQRTRLALLMRHLANILQEGWRQCHSAAAGWQHWASQVAGGGGLCSSARQPMRKPGPSAAMREAAALPPRRRPHVPRIPCSCALSLHHCTL